MKLGYIRDADTNIKWTYVNKKERAGDNARDSCDCWPVLEGRHVPNRITCAQGNNARVA